MTKVAMKGFYLVSEQFASQGDRIGPLPLLTHSNLHVFLE